MSENEIKIVEEMKKEYDGINWRYFFAEDATERILKERNITKENPDYKNYFDNISMEIGSKFLNDPYILM